MTNCIKTLSRLIISCLLFLSIALNAMAQQQKINLQNAPQNIAGLFTYLQGQYGLRFFYNNDVVKPEQKVAFSAKELSLSDLLKELTSQTGLTFSLKENNLIVVEDNRIQPVPQTAISGFVREESTGNPLAGVTVLLEGTTRGTMTDSDGKYSLNLRGDGDIVVFSFIGYATVKVPYSGQKNIDVSLKEELNAIDEVLVTALSLNRTKSSLGYSISSIDGDELNKSKDNNLINTLSGKIAGLQISKSSTGVDGSTRVVLRGVSSLTGENRPLIVVDGIPVDASYGGGTRWGGTDQGDALSDLNPADIESMSILKGAGAAAAYGSRGANGVILITTKKGLLKKGLGVTLQSTSMINTPMLYPEFQNEYGHGAFGTYPSAMPDPGMPWAWSYGPKMDGQSLPNYWGSTSPLTPQPYNYKDFFRNGYQFTNSVAIESGNEVSSVRATVTTDNNQGIIPTNTIKKQTVNLRGYTKIKNILELDGKMTYIHSQADNRPEVAEGSNNPGYMLSIMPRNMVSSDLLQHNEVNGRELLWTTDGYTNNPYWQLSNNINWDEKNRLQGVFSGKITFTKTLNLLLRSGMDFTNRDTHSQKSKGSQGSSNTGSINNQMGNTLEWNTDFLLGFHPDMKNKIQFNANLGGNYRYNNSKGLSQWGTNLKVDDFFAISNAGAYGTDEYFSEKQVYSIYGLSSVSYNNWLYLDLTLRNDWSSTLPVNNNSYLYHSENLSFLFTKALQIESDILSSGKLRTSYSKVGNDTDPYQVSKYYNVYQTQLPYPMGEFSDVLPTFDLQPEITKSWEIGTNLDFYKSRFVLDITYYRNTSENQIMNVPLPPSSGFSTKKMNAAELKNTGFEVQLDVAAIRQKELNWNIVATWSKNSSEVVRLAGSLESIILDDAWHATIQARPGDRYGDIYTTDYKRDNFGNVLVDDNGYVMKGDNKVMGNINPDWIGGISNNLTWKDFSLSFLIDIRMGGNIYSMGKAYRALFGTSAETLSGRADWYATHDPAYNYITPLPGVAEKGYVEQGLNETTGKPNTVPIDPIYRWYNIWSKEIGTPNILDATNIRMREISFGYTLSPRVLAKTPLSDLRISLVGRNLFFFYNAMKDIDPESGYSSGATGGGFEHCSIPTTRNYGINISVNF
jgi:TonB-linked SusC/RagA family outer membrane protein